MAIPASGGAEPTDVLVESGPRYGAPVSAPRIAFVVFNQMHHDTRVIREAQAAVNAGATVRVYAFGGKNVSLYPAGLGEVEGIEVDRIPVVTLAALAGPFLNILKRRRAASSGSSASSASHSIAAATEPELVALLPVGSTNGVVRTVLRQVQRFDKVLRQFTFWYRTVKAIRTWGPNLVHAHDANTLMVVGCAARRLKVPFVYDSHELWTRRNIAISRPVASRLEGPMERYWTRRASGVITVSAGIAAWLQEKYELKSTPILVRNIPPLKGAAPPPEAGRLRALAGLGPDACVIVYCGKITTNRGIERGLEAMPHLAEDVHLVLLGPGSPAQLTEVARLSESLGISHRVHVVGAVPSEEVSEAMADAQVSLVLTQPVVLSYAFSLPNKLFESMHAGIPVLASDTPDAAAMVREYGLGEVVAAEDTPAEVAQAIRHVIERAPEFRANAAQAAQVLNWQREVVSLIDVHKAALQTQGGKVHS